MFGTIFLMIQKFFVLTFGLTFGFWLLVTAAKEDNWKKILGTIFAWILIVYTFVVSGMICFQWMEYLRTGKLSSPCPMHQMMHGKKMHQMQKMKTPCPCPCPIQEQKSKEEDDDDDENED